MKPNATCVFTNFRPLPLLGNRHVQTLLGHFISGPSMRRFPTRQEILWLPDGDGLVLHDTRPSGWTESDPIAVLVHGLTGSHASGTIQRLGVFLLEKGVRVVRVDRRGAGAGLNLARGCYHAGRSEDLRAVLAAVHEWSPTAPRLLAGVSLGGNVVLKLAGEAAEHPVPGLTRVVAVGPPIDLARCAALLAHPGNRIYDRMFVSELVADARRRMQLFPELPVVNFPRRLTVREFDELYTAPHNGFADAADYYRRCSAAPLVPHIPVPTLIVTARDDPFIAVEPFEELRLPDHMTLRVVPQGGHLGFLGRDGSGGIRWVERRIADWLTAGLGALATVVDA